MAALQSSTEGHPPKLPSRSFLDILSPQSSVNYQPRPSTNFRGFPSVAFSDEEITRFSAPFRHALIGKFSNGRPPMETIRKSFISIGFAGTYTLGLIDHRHILIKFNIEDDYVRAFLKRIYTFDGFPMRIFKWSPDFSVDSESATLPIWINFPLLPLHFFDKEALYSIAWLIGEPLKLDASTAALTRPSVARVCVELDLRKNRPEKVWLVNGANGFWQPVAYEKIPPLCSQCCKIGHQSEACRSAEFRPVAASVKDPLPPKVRREYRPKLASIPNLQSSADQGYVPSVVVLPHPAAPNQFAEFCTPVVDAATDASNPRMPSSIPAVLGSAASSFSQPGAKSDSAQDDASGRVSSSFPAPYSSSFTSNDIPVDVPSVPSLTLDLLAVNSDNVTSLSPPKLANLVYENSDLVALCQSLESSPALSSVVPVSVQISHSVPSVVPLPIPTLSLSSSIDVCPLVEVPAPACGGDLNPNAPLFNPRKHSSAESSKSFVQALLSEKLPSPVSVKPRLLAVKSAEFPLFNLPQFDEFYPPSSLIPPDEPESSRSRVNIYVFSDGDDVPRLPSSRQLLSSSLQSFNKKLKAKFSKNRKFLGSSKNRKKWKKLAPISTPCSYLSSGVVPPFNKFCIYYGPNTHEEQSDDDAPVEYENVWRSSSSEDESTYDFDYPLASIEALMALEYEDFSLSPPRRRKYN